MQIKISHSTSYHYDTPVYYGLQQLRLTPKAFRGQNILSWETHVEGGVKELEYDDHNLNRVILIKLDPNQTDLTIRTTGEVETVDNAGIVGRHISHIPLWLYRRETMLTKSQNGIKRIARLVQDKGLDGLSDVERLHFLSKCIIEHVPYEIGATFPETSAEEAIAHGAGVCQDHAHIFVASARFLGFPARYVSGYLFMEDRIEQDATHAWAEAYIEGLGWVGFDVSNQISPDGRYVRVASGLDYRDCAPIIGLRHGQGAEKLIVSLQVQQ